MTTSQTESLATLKALRRAVDGTTVLATILDQTWFEAVQGDLLTSSAGKARSADPSGFVLDFCHPLRGVDWFEADHELWLQGRINEVDEKGRLALWSCGSDPVRTLIPLLEQRLRALVALPFKRPVIRTKLEQLRSVRSNPSFKTHLFEVAVLGDLAHKGVLVDVEDGVTGVDGAILLDGREILVEATATVHEVLADSPSRVFFTDPDVEINQVVYKVRMKVANGRQLALANGKPAILFLARTRRGAGRVAARMAFRDCFRDPEFATLSGVVLADSWRFQVTSWERGERPDAPLSRLEEERMIEWYRPK